ncbi:hypothetical protein Gpo141_00000773 [Globisporangium polare]
MTPLNALRYAVIAASMVTAARAYDELLVPSFDFRTLAYSNAVASELEKYGMITISDVPGYADLRREYLHAAAECAWQRPSKDSSRGILYRELDDGTKRFTISSTNGVDHLAWDACFKYQRCKVKFSELVAKAIDGFSAAFDASFTAVSQSSRLREFVSSARDMDHFHAYVPVHEKKRVEQVGSSAAATSAQEPSESNPDPEERFALSMHSDSGLFIAMSAPAFFQVSPQNASVLEEIPNPDKASGLLIKLRDDKTVVRPLQKDDELTVMVGDGFSTWVQLPVKIPAVVHGMRMPQTRHKDSQVIRAWYGKMVLLSESATMLNTGMEFAAYSRQLGEFVESGGSFPSQFASVACPANRQLSNNACNYRLCHPFSASTTKEQCDFWCNTHSMGIDFAALCQSNCVCQHHAVSENTFECWMSCFEKSDECDGDEWCTEKILNDRNPIAVRSCDGVANTTTKMTKHLRAKVKAFRVTVVEEESDSEDDESSDSAN